MAYLGWLMKTADNSYGTGNYDLISERPDNWQEMSGKYGYIYDPDALNSYESIRDALLRGVGDASSAAGSLSGDISTMTRIINLYYLTEDTDGNTRLENMSYAFQNAFNTMRGATGHLSTGMSYLDQVGGYLSGNEPLTLQGVDSDFRTAMENLFDDLGGVSSGLSQLATQSANHSMQIISDMQAVNDQFNVVMVDLVDILQLALDPSAEDVIEDVSESDVENTTNGKVFNCENYGAARAISTPAASPAPWPSSLTSRLKTTPTPWRTPASPASTLPSASWPTAATTARPPPAVTAPAASAARAISA